MMTKKIIVFKITSFILISFVFFTAGYFALNSASAQTSGANLVIPPTNLPSNSGGIKAILENVLKWILGIFGAIAIISFVISGIQYFMAAGNEKILDTAKRNMTYSIIGIIVALASFVIIQAIDTALRGSSTNF